MQATPFDRALALQNSGKFEEAIKGYEKLLEKNPDHPMARVNIGVCHYALGRASIASEIFHSLHISHPENDDLIKFAGIAYMAAGNFDMALKFHRRYINAHPDDYETWLNLASASGSNQNDKEALLYATQALSLRPLDPRSHLNMGAALIPLHRYQDALIAFDTALTLEPNNLKALMNKATCHDMMGNPSKSLEIYETCEKLVGADRLARADLEYKMSFPLLSTGDLKRGWKYYNSGFIPLDTRSRFPKRRFSVPEWDGKPIHGKRLMVWREQGLGDEIKFASVLPDLLKFCDDIIIECDTRMVSLFQRSFPTCLVREQRHDHGQFMTGIEDYDFQIPMGSLMAYLRTDISDFANQEPYLIADPTRTSELKQRIDQIRGGRILVGICWRSGLLNVERNINYTPISSWGPILTNPRLCFVNLQYGDTREEIANAEELFGIKIHQWDDINLKDDQESVAALIENMDCVVSAVTAVGNLAEAMGKKAKLFTPGRGWTFLGQERFPWAPNAEYYFPDPIGSPISNTLEQIARDLYIEYGQD